MARLCQWSAPARVLGTFPAVPRIRRDLLAAVTHGDLAGEADFVDQCLLDHFETRQAMELSPQDLSVALINSGSICRELQAGSSLLISGSLTCILIDGGFGLVRRE